MLINHETDPSTYIAPQKLTEIIQKISDEIVFQIEVMQEIILNINIKTKEKRKNVKDILLNILNHVGKAEYFLQYAEQQKGKITDEAIAQIQQAKQIDQATAQIQQAKQIIDKVKSTIKLAVNNTSEDSSYNLKLCSQIDKILSILISHASDCLFKSEPYRMIDLEPYISKLAQQIAYSRSPALPASAPIAPRGSLATPGKTPTPGVTVVVKPTITTSVKTIPLTAKNMGQFIADCNIFAKDKQEYKNLDPKEFSTTDDTTHQETKGVLLHFNHLKEAKAFLSEMAKSYDFEVCEFDTKNQKVGNPIFTAQEGKLTKVEEKVEETEENSAAPHPSGP